MTGYFDNLSESVVDALVIAQSETKDFGVKEIGNLTLFIGILAEAKSQAATELNALGVNYESVKPVATKFFRYSQKPGALGQLKQALRDLQIRIMGIPLSQGANRTFEFAQKQAEIRGSQILPEDLLLIMLRQKDPELTILLGKLKVNMAWLQEKVLQLLETETKY
jgi:ATP-dependent Clp protease ATP-binding subunit ClpA